MPVDPQQELDEAIAQTADAVVQHEVCHRDQG
jgi:hypothetical protein